MQNKTGLSPSNPTHTSPAAAEEEVCRSEYTGHQLIPGQSLDSYGRSEQVFERIGGWSACLRVEEAQAGSTRLCHLEALGSYPPLPRPPPSRHPHPFICVCLT